MTALAATSIFERESAVRSYARGFPTQFSTASGTFMKDRNGRNYLDFLSGCGSLNYGHNHPALIEALVSYVRSNGIALSLDMETDAKARFMEAFRDHILEPRGLSYKLQFSGPTGTNAVEAAIKLARKVTGRTNIVAFTNAFHGCSLGALALTGSSAHRAAATSLLGGVTRLPFDGYFGPEIDTAAMLERLLDDPSSGVDRPAAVVLEVIQGEGGLNVASADWLRRVADTARRHGALLIIDDIQAGCGRSGRFFSFEASGVVPDMVVMAKSLSGFGLPMALVLLDPRIDAWTPGEHNGTFRGNGHAFVTGAAALDLFWSGPDLADSVQGKAAMLHARLSRLAGDHGLRVKGAGLMQGIDLENGDLCGAVRRACFEAGLILEAAGAHDEVLKLMPPLTVIESEIDEAIEIIAAQLEALAPVGAGRPRAVAVA